MKKLILAFLMVCSVMPLGAKTINRRDSLGTAFSAKQLIAPCSVMTAGLALHYGAHQSLDYSIKGCFDERLQGKEMLPDFENWLQYVPVAMDLTMGLMGAKAENPFLDRVIEASLAYISVGLINGSAKFLFYTLRPNEVDYRSFPSGHTAFVFTGAELVRLEYGWGWGAAAYAMACTVGYMRMYHNWHWMSDVVMAAGVGILCADMGRWLLDPTKRLFGMKTEKIKLSLSPSIDPLSGTLCTQLALRF